MYNSERTQIIYSLPVGHKKQGQTRVYRHPKFRQKLFELPSNIQSLQNVWDDCVSRWPEKKIVQDLTYSQLNDSALKVGSWILSRGIKKILMYCKNCPNWTIIDIACWNYGIVNIPLYDTLGAEAFHYIISLTQSNLIFMGNQNLPNFFKYFTDKEHCIKQVCLWEEPTPDDRHKLNTMGLKISTFSQLLNNSKVQARPKLSLQTELTYMFTSGTTGIPKGAIYTHQMIATELNVFIYFMDLGPDDIHMSFLPVAHIYERLVDWYCLFCGAHIIFTKNPVAQLVKDLMTIKPTFLTLVPRLLNRFYPIMKGIYDKQGSYDKVKGMFGGRIKRISTASAPVSPEILQFFSKALNCQITEAYGQTQTSGGTFSTLAYQKERGHVGGPIPAVQFKLIDVPQMQYNTNSNPPYGQVCTRGPTVFRKYYKDPKNTQQTIDQEGWNHSGDIGVILPNGALKIVDRRKNIFKLQQGQYIAPEKIENIYARCKFVSETFVYGDSLHHSLIAIVHPNLQMLPLLCQKLGISTKDPKTICENPEVEKFILSELTAQAKKDGLHGFEIAKKIKLWPQPFQALDLVTTSMKLKRYQAKKFFDQQIKNLYKLIEN